VTPCGGYPNAVRPTERDPTDGAGSATVRDRTLDERAPGTHADTPARIPPKGWWEALRRGYREFNADQMGLIAAGVAFKAFLSIVPTLIAAMLLYGLVVDPSQVQRQVESLSGVLPTSAQDLLRQQMDTLVATNRRDLGIGLVISLLVALWSASGGTGNLLQAVNDAYDETETRGWFKRKALALLMTVGAILVFAVTATLVAAFPAVANALNLPPAVRVALESARWLVILVVVGVSLAVLYHVAPARPARDTQRLRWVSVGAAVAVVLWIAISVGFSIYVDQFSSYNATYGSAAGVVVLLMWLWLSVYAVLLGAEINAQSEKQTVNDTTVSAPRRPDRRHALKADLGPDDPEPDGGRVVRDPSDNASRTAHDAPSHRRAP
jgi:membrane protein